MLMVLLRDLGFLLFWPGRSESLPYALKCPWTFRHDLSLQPDARTVRWPARRSFRFSSSPLTCFPVAIRLTLGFMELSTFSVMQSTYEARATKTQTLIVLTLWRPRQDSNL